MLVINDLQDGNNIIKEANPGPAWSVRHSLIARAVCHWRGHSCRGAMTNFAGQLMVRYRELPGARGRAAAVTGTGKLADHVTTVSSTGGDGKEQNGVAMLDPTLAAGGG